ncbi:MAG: YjjG family noncanonical pyrimidine nucleotidase [Bacteroidota bacterium]
MAKYACVFFDLDRTIWDFKKNADSTFRDIYNKHKLGNIFENFDSFICIYETINEKLWDDYRKGLTTKEILRYERFRKTLEYVGNKDENLAIIIGDEYVYDSPKKTEVLPHAHETLKYLKSKYNLYIITNGFKEVQEIKLQNSKLKDYFAEVFISEDIGIQKPDVRVMHFVLSRLKAKPEACIMIGDDLSVDVECAKNAGIDQVYFNPEKLIHSGNPTYEINDLIELKRIL